jgi:hypothetical protein
MNFVNHLDGVEVIHTRINAHLVQNGNTGGLGLIIKLPDGIRDVTRRHDVCTTLDSSLNDSGMISVWNERNDNVVSRDMFGEIIR